MRHDEVYGQLAQVYDPELDQPLTELGFIGGVTVEGGVVTVRFRLPTFWCAANFAFMMAADIRERVSELPWVERVQVQLQDHFFDDEINEGINDGKTFAGTFPALATDDLDGLRETFRVKAFLTRQERVVRSLLAQGWVDEAILGVRVGDLPALALDGERAALVGRYLAILSERGLAADPSAPAFVNPDGTRSDAPEFRAHIACASRTRLSVEFNTMFCRGLLETRYGVADADNAACVDPSSVSGHASRRTLE
jgi:metal-sulfur cluster biosynthetic enzyme